MRSLKILGLAILVGLTTNQAFSQIEFGIVGGLSSTNIEPTELVSDIGNDNYSVKFLEADYGFHFGLYSRVTIANFFIQPALTFNSSSYTYSIEDLNDGGAIEVIGQERYNNLDIPVLFGCKVLGILRVQAGPVGHVHLNSSSELFDFDGYSQKFKEFTYGYQAGVGLDLFKLRVDLNYEGNFSKFGEHINIGGNNYQIDDSPSRLILSIGIKL